MNVGLFCANAAASNTLRLVLEPRLEANEFLNALIHYAGEARCCNTRSKAAPSDRLVVLA